MRFFLILLLSLLLPLKGTDIIFLSEELSDALLQNNEGISILEAQSVLDPQTAEQVLSDYKNIIPQDFKISPYFRPYVNFWFGIYTKYTSDHIVIHDKEDLSIVYAVLDFTQVEKALHRNARSAIVQRLSRDKVEEIKQTIRELAKGNTQSRLAISILKLIQHKLESSSGDEKKKREILLTIANNIRTQTGQRDLIEAGAIRMLPYKTFFEDKFELFKLPPQLIAIPFLESSFNTEAHSKVGALGIWQFMPLIASYFMPKRTPWLDYRNNPFISSIAAMHLLRENKQILKSWDMAVTAYNSGTKHLIQARRQYAVNNLEEVFTKYKNDHLGFASQNFYSEFIALVYTLSYLPDVFPSIGKVQAVDNPLFAVSKCSFVPSTLLKKYKLDDALFKKLNPHIESMSKIHPKGTILVHQGALPKSQFYQINLKEVVKFRPLYWSSQLIRNQSCSTR